MNRSFAWLIPCLLGTLAVSLAPADEQSAPSLSTPADNLPLLIGIDGRSWRQTIESVDLQGRIHPSPAVNSLTLDDLLEMRFPAEASVPSRIAGAREPLIQVRLRSGSLIQAASLLLVDERVTIRWPMIQNPVICSIDALASITYATSQSPIPVNDPRWKPALDADRLLVRDGDRVISISGLITQISGEGVELEVDGETRRVARETLSAVIMAAPEEARRPTTRRFELSDGSAIETDWLLFADSKWKTNITQASGQGGDAPAPSGPTRPANWEAELPTESMRRLEIRSPRVVWLSDLSPRMVDEQAIAGRPLPWRRDLSVLGGPLKLGGTIHRRGIGVRARSQLEYNLPANVESFVATVGLDDAAQGRGECEVVVLGDGSVPLWKATVRGGDAPRSIHVALQGRERLTLVVEPGPHLDLSDFVDWGDARLVRSSPPPTPKK
ncbi:MAG: NPCBM/NEW2 domain-containing protein [Pirellulales bacterium]